ncbi:hypothetical protein GCM10007908_24810 [Rhizobium albus]|nr:hypothetical protein GCM10007908_24810 [Rhizobium albus]
MPGKATPPCPIARTFPLQLRNSSSAPRYKTACSLTSYCAFVTWLSFQLNQSVSVTISAAMTSAGQNHFLNDALPHLSETNKRKGPALLPGLSIKPVGTD